MTAYMVITADGAPLDYVECAPSDVIWRGRLIDLYRAWGACYVVNAWGQRV